MNSKRGIALHWIGFVLAFFLGIGAFSYYYITTEKPMVGDYIGDFQLNIIKNFKKGERALLYIDQSAKTSLEQSIYDLAKKGGYSKEAECNSYQGINSWVSIERENGIIKIKECYPKDTEIKNSLIEGFDDNFDEYIANYPEIYIPYSYSYDIQGNLEINGKSSEDLVIYIYKDAEFIAIPAGYSKLNLPMKANPDIETVKQYHPEVWENYIKLCKRMEQIGMLDISPGACTTNPQKCCITSGYRHPVYNKEIAGAKDSPHQYGSALDIYVGKNIEEQLEWAKAATEVGFTRVGIYPGSSHIHIDMMDPEGQYTARYWIGYKGTTQYVASNIDELKAKSEAFG